MHNPLLPIMQRGLGCPSPACPYFSICRTCHESAASASPSIRTKYPSGASAETRALILPIQRSGCSIAYSAKRSASITSPSFESLRCGVASISSTTLQATPQDSPSAIRRHISEAISSSIPIWSSYWLLSFCNDNPMSRIMPRISCVAAPNPTWDSTLPYALSQGAAAGFGGPANKCVNSTETSRTTCSRLSCAWPFAHNTSAVASLSSDPLNILEIAIQNSTSRPTASVRFMGSRRELPKNA